MEKIKTLVFKPWWRHQMETFSALLAICAENSPVTGEFPYKGQWRGALMFSLICASINGWVNNGKAGDLTRHRAHYDVTVMHDVCVGRSRTRRGYYTEIKARYDVISFRLDQAARAVMMCIENKDLPQGALIKIVKDGNFLMYPEKMPCEKLLDP